MQKKARSAMLTVSKYNGWQDHCAIGTLSCVGCSSRNFISFDKTSFLNISETLKMAREFAIQASFQISLFFFHETF